MYEWMMPTQGDKNYKANQNVDYLLGCLNCVLAFECQRTTEYLCISDWSVKFKLDYSNCSPRTDIL